jgi:PHO85 cyclin-1
MVSRYQSFNNKIWESFIHSRVSSEMICYLARKASIVIQCDPTLCVPSKQTISIVPFDGVLEVTKASQQLDGTIPTLETFISCVVRKSNVQVPTLMTTLLYLSRLCFKLPPAAIGHRCTAHRIFLACLILSSKFLNDCSPKNKHWAACSRIRGFSFSRKEVNLMERQLLFLLNWDLNFDQLELEHHFEPFLVRIRDSMAKIRSIDCKDNRRALNKRKSRSELQQPSNTATPASNKILKRGSKQPFSSRPRTPFTIPNSVVLICQKCQIYSISTAGSKTRRTLQTLLSHQHEL